MALLSYPKSPPLCDTYCFATDGLFRCNFANAANFCFSGRYFVKPQIKEYEFEPKHELLELAEGQGGQVGKKLK